MIQYFDVDTGTADPKPVGFTGIVPGIGERSRPINAVGPDLGEHTAEILGQFGIDRATLEALAKDGVIGLGEPRQN